MRESHGSVSIPSLLPKLWWSEILPYLQANKLPCHTLVDIGKRHETPVEEVDSLLLSVIAVAGMSAFVLASWSFLGYTCVHWGLYYWREALSLGNPNLLHWGSVPVLCSRVPYSNILDSKHTCPLLQRETLYPSRLFAFVDVLKNVVQSKGQLVPSACSTFRKDRPIENCFQHRSIVPQ